MRLSARGLRLRLTVDLLWIPTRLVCNLRQAPGGTRHHNFMLCVVLAVPVCTGKVSLNLEIEPFDENRVKIKHKLSYVRPTNRGKISEEDTTETPMYVNRGGRLTILQEDQGQLLTLAGEPDGKLRAAGH
ncbi:hypothetical protein GSL00_30645 [Escherichia coli]|nr:hypothetical protein [Escherichia coli]